MMILSVPKAARKADRGEDVIRKAIKAGTLTAVKVGGTWVIEEEELQRWIGQPAAQPAAPQPPRIAAPQPAVEPAAQKPTPATQAETATRPGGAPDLSKRLSSIK